MNIKHPLFSVVIPLYNKEDTVERTLKAIAKQSERDFEVIVVDDGSTDASASVVEKCRAFIDITLVRKRNGGVSSARNEGAKCANGKYIASCDADDEWLPKFLAELRAISVKFPKAKVLGTDYAYEIKGKRISGKEINKIEMIDFFEEWPYRSPVHTSSFAVERDYYFDTGGYNERMHFYEDAEFLSRLALKEKFAVSRKVLALYHSDARDRATRKSELRINMPHWNLWERLIRDKKAGIQLRCCAMLELRGKMLENAVRFHCSENCRLLKSYPVITGLIFHRHWYVSKWHLYWLYPVVATQWYYMRFQKRRKIKITAV